MSEPSFRLALAYLDGTSPIAAAPFSVLIECEADNASMAALAGSLEELGLGERAVLAVDAGAGLERLRRIREAIPEAIAAAGVSHKFDIGVPGRRAGRASWSGSTRARRGGVAAGSRASCTSATSATATCTSTSSAPIPPTNQSTRRCSTWVAECGGTISAEHGVGVHKARYLRLGRSPAGEIDAMWAIKQPSSPQPPQSRRRPGVRD